MKDTLTQARLITAASVRHGDHVCSAFGSPVEQEELLIDFVSGGLEAGDRVFLAANGERHRLLEALHRAGVEIDIPLTRGQLRITDRFDGRASRNPLDMLQELEAIVADALAGGYRGARFTGDLCAGLAGDDLARWEAMLSDFCRRHPVTGLCQYDRRAVEPGQLELVMELHPLRAQPPQISHNDLLRITELTPDGSRLRLAGEADISSGDLLATVLEKALHAGTDVHVHAHGLEFIDVSGLRALVQAAMRVVPERRFVVHQPCGSLVRLLELLPGCSDLIEVAP